MRTADFVLPPARGAAPSGASPAVPADAQARTPEGLRERKKRLTREAILVRAVTSDEVRDLIAAAAADASGQQARQAQREALREWIRDAAGSLARGLQATRR